MCDHDIRDSMPLLKKTEPIISSRTCKYWQWSYQMRQFLFYERVMGSSTNPQMEPPMGISTHYWVYALDLKSPRLIRDIETTQFMYSSEFLRLTPWSLSEILERWVGDRGLPPRVIKGTCIVRLIPTKLPWFSSGLPIILMHSIGCFTIYCVVHNLLVFWII